MLTIRRRLLLFSLFLPLEAAATQALTDIGNSYRDATGNWYLAIFPYAQSLFASLAAIQLVWSAIRWMLAGEGIERIFSNLLVLMMGLGLFYAILLNFNTWIPAIINSFIQIGTQASGISMLDPSSVFDLGISLAGTLLRSLGGGGLIDSVIGAMVGGFASLVIIICFAIISGQLLVALVESFIVIGSGVLLVGFAGSTWTIGITERSLGYAIAVGVKLFMLYLIIGLGVAVAVAWLPTLENASLDSPDPLYAVVGSSIVFLMISWAIPAMASSLVTGGVSMTLGGAMTSALLTGAGAAAVGAGGAKLMGQSMQTLTRATQDLTAAIKHGQAVGQGTGSVARGVGAGVGALARETGRVSMARMTGGRSPVASNIGRRTAMFRSGGTNDQGTPSPIHRPRRTGQALRTAAHNIPRDQADFNSPGIRMKVDD